MADNIKFKTSAKTVSNAKTKEQDSKLTQAKKSKEEALENAKKARQEEENKKALKQESKEDNIDTKQVVELASKVINSSKKQSGGFIKGVILGIVIGLVIGIFVGPNLLTSTLENSKEDADVLIDETFLGYTALDFKQAILGEATQKQELIVMEQPLEIETTITKAGLGNLEIFSKVKNVSFSGNGIFTVDLSKISEDTIDVDEENKIVTIYIPHAKLYEVVPNLDNMKFEDTEKGLLAFGDISLTMEDQNELEKSVKQAMQDKLNQQDILDNADEFAIMKSWEIFRPLVNAVSNQFVVEVVIK